MVETCAIHPCSNYEKRLILYLKLSRKTDNVFLYNFGKKLFFNGYLRKARQTFRSIDKNHINWFRGRFFIIANYALNNKIYAVVIELKEIDETVLKLMETKIV